MNVFFDVDDTLVSSQSGALRPLVVDVLRDLSAEGHRIYVWSAMGIRWIAMDRHGLRPFITACFSKPIKLRRRSLAPLGIDVQPDFVVDDEADVVEAFRGYVISPYIADDPSDREMAVVRDLVRSAALSA